MNDVTNEVSQQESGAAPAVETSATRAEPRKVRQVLAALKRHPLGWVVALGAATALIEVELAVGIIAGVGATALLASKSGPEARHEVVAKSKAAIARARVMLASRKHSPSDTSPSAAAEAPTAPAASAPGTEAPATETPAAPVA